MAKTSKGETMKLVVGYDRALSRQFFLRSVSELSSRKEFARLPADETEYLAERFGEIATVSRFNQLSSPTASVPDYRLFLLCRSQPTRSMLQQAEIRANELLFCEGFNAFGGLYPLSSAIRKPAKLPLIKDLYRLSASGAFRSERESELLKHLAAHTKVWLRVMGFIPGSDLLERMNAATWV